MKRPILVLALFIVVIVGALSMFLAPGHGGGPTSPHQERVVPISSDGELDQATARAEETEISLEWPSQELPTPFNSEALLYLGLKENYPKLAERIEQQRDELRAESTEASLQKLGDIEMFIWPGMHHEAVIYVPSKPLPPGHDKYMAKQVLSNRRVHKLLQELGEMPVAEVENVLRERLALAHDRYLKLRAEKDSENVYATEPNVVSVFFRLSNMPDGSPRLTGAQHEVLSLLYLAGELRVGGLHSEITSIATTLVEERDNAYGRVDGSPPENYRASFWKGSTLYNRPILLKALMGTSGHESGQGAFLQDQDAHVLRFELTHWDAELSVFDQLARYGVPPDYRKGRFPTELLVGITDQQFDAFLTTSGIAS